MMTLTKALGSNSYPGRGILLGTSEDERYAVAAYFIMGRSVNSRNRIFAANDFSGIKTVAFDESKLTDPSLIIYNAVSVIGDETIVTNGDQTDTVYEHLKSGGTFEEALYTREFEPDRPNFTPRISGLIKREKNDVSFKLSILKSGDEKGESCIREFFSYSAIEAGVARLIHTYEHDGDPIPSFSGEPKAVKISGDIDFVANELWSALDSDNKVSLFVRFIDKETGEYSTRVIDKNE